MVQHGRFAPSRPGLGAAPEVRVDGHGGRRDQSGVGAVFAGRTTRASYDVCGELKTTTVWPATKPVCGPGQHLPIAKGWAASRRTVNEPGTADFRWAGDETLWAWNSSLPGQQCANQKWVERINRVLQDRLVKALPLEGLRAIWRQAGKYLAGRICAEHNRRSQSGGFKPASLMSCRGA